MSYRGENDTFRERLKTACEHFERGCTTADVVKKMGIGKRTARRYRELWKNGEGQAKVVAEPLPDPDISVERILEIQKERFTKRLAYESSKRWRQIKIRMEGPVGIGWIGDPHVDADGCNWPLLHRDLDLLRDTEGAFGACVGDYINGWAGRLVKLYAEQEMSRSTSYKLARWLFQDSGVDWIALVLGNHDLWQAKEILGAYAEERAIVCEDWQIQMELTFPKGRNCKVWMAHDFPGVSQWNILHSLMKAAKMREPADFFVAGHKHEWAIFEGEDPDTGHVYTCARTRGYKHIDHYAKDLGYGWQQYGSTVFTVIDPLTPHPQAYLKAFCDVEEGIDYLKYRRRKC